MYYTYLLLSSKDGEWYTGATSDLKARLREHAQGEVTSTRSRRSLRLVHYEACLDAADAYRREGYLKTGKGKRYLRQSLPGPFPARAGAGKTWRAQFSQEKLERR